MPPLVSTGDASFGPGMYCSDQELPGPVLVPVPPPPPRAGIPLAELVLFRPPELPGIEGTDCAVAINPVVAHTAKATAKVVKGLKA